MASIVGDVLVGSAVEVFSLHACDLGRSVQVCGHSRGLKLPVTSIFQPPRAGTGVAFSLVRVPSLHTSSFGRSSKLAWARIPWLTP